MITNHRMDLFEALVTIHAVQVDHLFARVGEAGGLLRQWADLGGKLLAWSGEEEDVVDVDPEY